MPQDGSATPVTQTTPSGDRLIAPQPKRPAHRPTDYNQDIAQTICERIAQGASIAEICSEDGMPCKVAVYSWLNRHEEFANAFSRAREASVEPMAERNAEIAADDSRDVLYHDGRPIPNSTAVKRAELRVGYNQWLMGKWSKRYADKQMVEHSGTVNLELSVRMDNAIKRLDQQPIDVTPERIGVQEPETKP